MLVAVSDLDATARAFEARFGLTSVEGGRHAAWGTENRIVPLGSSFVELVAVTDPDVAAAAPFGRWVAAATTGLAGWVVRVPRLAPVASRLGLTISSGSRRRSAGEVLRWRVSGIEEAAAEPCLPFFIEWGAATSLPGAVPVEHPAGRVRLARVELLGDPARVKGWLDDAVLPIAVRAGPPCVSRIVLDVDGREIPIDAIPGV